MKPTHIIWLFAMLFICSATYGQDVLYLKGGKKDTVQIEEVTAKEVIYKKYRDVNGPELRLPKSEILLIQYANGNVEIIKPTEEEAQEDEKKRKAKRWIDDPLFVSSLGNNMVGINLLNLMNGNANVFYEYITPSKKVGLKFTANVSFLKGQDDPEIIKYQRVYTGGLDLQFYPRGQGKVKYFIGPSIRTGLLNKYNNPYYDGVRKSYYNHPADFGYFSLMFSNGLIVNASEHIFISFQAAVGIARFRYLNYKEGTGFEKKFIDNDGMISLNVGYRF